MMFFQCRISIDDMHPPLWRRCIFASEVSFLELVSVIHILFDWRGDEVGRISFQTRDKQEKRPGEEDHEALEHLTVGTFFQKDPRRLLRYTFEVPATGVRWEHEIVCERVLTDGELTPAQRKAFWSGVPVIVTEGRGGNAEENGPKDAPRLPFKLKKVQEMLEFAFSEELASAEEQQDSEAFFRKVFVPLSEEQFAQTVEKAKAFSRHLEELQQRPQERKRSKVVRLPAWSLLPLPVLEGVAALVLPGAAMHLFSIEDYQKEDEREKKQALAAVFDEMARRVAQHDEDIRFPDEQDIRHIADIIQMMRQAPDRPESGESDPEEVDRWVRSFLEQVAEARTARQYGHAAPVKISAQEAWQALPVSVLEGVLQAVLPQFARTAFGQPLYQQSSAEERRLVLLQFLDQTRTEAAEGLVELCRPEEPEEMEEMEAVEDIDRFIVIPGLLGEVLELRTKKSLVALASQLRLPVARKERKQKFVTAIRDCLMDPQNARLFLLWMPGEEMLELIGDLGLPLDTTWLEAHTQAHFIDMSVPKYLSNIGYTSDDIWSCLHLPKDAAALIEKLLTKDFLVTYRQYHWLRRCVQMSYLLYEVVPFEVLWRMLGLWKEFSLSREETEEALSSLPRVIYELSYEDGCLVSSSTPLAVRKRFLKRESVSPQDFYLPREQDVWEHWAGPAALDNKIRRAYGHLGLSPDELEATGVAAAVPQLLFYMRYGIEQKPLRDIWMNEVDMPWEKARKLWEKLWPYLFDAYGDLRRPEQLGYTNNEIRDLSKSSKQPKKKEKPEKEKKRRRSRPAAAKPQPASDKVISLDEARKRLSRKE